MTKSNSGALKKRQKNFLQRKNKTGNGDFQKKRVRVGEKAKRENQTAVELKHRRLRITEQSIADSLRTDKPPVTHRQWTLRQCITYGNHYQASMRKEAVMGVREVWSQQPDHPEHLSLQRSVVEMLGRRLVDDDATVREACASSLRSLWPVVFSSEPFYKLWILFLCSAMTHHDAKVRLESLRLCEGVMLYLDGAPNHQLSRNQDHPESSDTVVDVDDDASSRDVEQTYFVTKTLEHVCRNITASRNIPAQKKLHALALHVLYLYVSMVPEAFERTASDAQQKLSEDGVVYSVARLQGLRVADDDRDEVQYDVDRKGTKVVYAAVTLSQSAGSVASMELSDLVSVTATGAQNVSLQVAGNNRGGVLDDVVTCAFEHLVELGEDELNGRREIVMTLSALVQQLGVGSSVSAVIAHQSQRFLWPEFPLVSVADDRDAKSTLSSLCYDLECAVLLSLLHPSSSQLWSWLIDTCKHFPTAFWSEDGALLLRFLDCVRKTVVQQDADKNLAALEELLTGLLVASDSVPMTGSRRGSWAKEQFVTLIGELAADLPVLRGRIFDGTGGPLRAWFAQLPKLAYVFGAKNLLGCENVGYVIWTLWNQFIVSGNAMMNSNFAALSKDFVKNFRPFFWTESKKTLKPIFGPFLSLPPHVQCRYLDILYYLPSEEFLSLQDAVLRCLCSSQCSSEARREYLSVLNSLPLSAFGDDAESLLLSVWTTWLGRQLASDDFTSYLELMESIETAWTRISGTDAPWSLVSTVLSVDSLPLENCFMICTYWGRKYFQRQPEDRSGEAQKLFLRCLELMSTSDNNKTIPDRFVLAFLLDETRSLAYVGDGVCNFLNSLFFSQAALSSLSIRWAHRLMKFHWPAVPQSMRAHLRDHFVKSVDFSAHLDLAAQEIHELQVLSSAVGGSNGSTLL